ncbi:MAG: DNA (cytosine-5-)-methyltransferase [Oscillospiraceae bacterium]
MIKLATVFSGIGAIEHALYRMGIEHKIVFACDNGDVDILNKEIGLNIDEMQEEIIELDSVIIRMQDIENVEDIYKKQLFAMFTEMSIEYNNIIKVLKSINKPLSDVSDVLSKVLSMKNIKKARSKEYSKFLEELNLGTELQKKLKEIQVILEITNDFKKDNSLEQLNQFCDFKSSDGIEWNIIIAQLKSLFEYLEETDGKKIIRKVQDISQRVGQLHEKINYLKVQEKLDALGDDWGERKKYVDGLYKGLEKRNKVKASYLANYDISEQDFHWNVAFLNGEQYKDQVDLFVGGSPCQSFSLVGKQRGLEDTRGTLFYEYARLIKEVNPKVFIYENVKAVTTHDGGKTWTKMQEVFDELGYKIYPDILNAKNYGIPQNRERVFVVGFRDDIAPKEEFLFPKPVALDKTMKDFLIDNAPGGYFLPKKGVEFVIREKNLEKRYTQIDGDVQLCQKKNQQFNWHGDFVFQSEQEAEEFKISDLEKYYLSEKVKKYVLASGTKNFYSRPRVDLDIARPLLTTMHKMHRAGVDNYVTTEGRLRKLTPRECLRLMGFSDTFKIVVSDTAMYQQAGNSIVVDVLIAILKQIDIERYGD